ncbi:MAG TPA: hypothetical protein VEB40_01025 [Flavipsychrobacter sp.]|nr:hypothetical protein [Flavipsychrobacter sp.]
MSQNKVYTVIGARGTGKTPFIRGGDFEDGMAKLWAKKNMSTLVIDEIDHPKYRDVPVLLPKDYKKLSTSVGLYRTICQTQYMDDLMYKIANEHLIWNTLIVFEDCPKYIRKSFRRDIELSLIGNSKQQNVDLCFINWNWSDTPPDLLKKTNYIAIFKTGDDPSYRKDSILRCYNACAEAQQLVNAGKHPYILIDTGL